jgi:hypothetical protein
MFFLRLQVLEMLARAEGIRDTWQLCASAALYLSANEFTRAKVLSAGAIRVVHEIMLRDLREIDDDFHEPTVESLAHTLINLVAVEDQWPRLLTDGAVVALRRMTEWSKRVPAVTQAKLRVEELLFRVCNERASRTRFVRLSGVRLVVDLLMSTRDTATLRACLGVLAVLSWHIDTRSLMVEAKGLHALVKILEDVVRGVLEGAQVPIEIGTLLAVELCLRALMNVSLNCTPTVALLLARGVVPVALEAQKAGLLTTTAYTYIMLMIRTLSGGSETCQRVVVKGGALELIYGAVHQLPGDGTVGLSCAVSLYNLATTRGLEGCLASEEVMEVMEVLSEQPICRAILSAVAYLISLQPQARTPKFSHRLLTFLLSLMYPEVGGVWRTTALNFCAAVLSLSEAPDCRRRMGRHKVVGTLRQLALSADFEVEDVASRALDWVEQGAVKLARGVFKAITDKKERHSTEHALSAPIIGTVGRSTRRGRRCLSFTWTGRQSE